MNSLGMNFIQCILQDTTQQKWRAQETLIGCSSKLQGNIKPKGPQITKTADSDNLQSLEKQFLVLQVSFHCHKSHQMQYISEYCCQNLMLSKSKLPPLV